MAVETEFVQTGTNHFQQDGQEPGGREWNETAPDESLQSEKVAEIEPGQQEAAEIHLQGAVGIASAADLKALLLDASSADRELKVHLGPVTEMDVCAWQLLIAAGRAWKQKSRAFTITGPICDGVRASMTDAGLEIPQLSQEG